jgi:Icc-related predicted phosphoesterase
MKINIDYISDLVLDQISFNGTMEEYIETILPVNKSDILIIAGNLGIDLIKILRFLKKLSPYYYRIFYVTGPKEMYLKEENYIFNWNSFTKLNTLKNILNSEKEFNNVILLDGFDKQRIVLEEYHNLSISGLGMFWDYSGLPENLSTREINDLYNIVLPDTKKIFFGLDENNKKRMIIASKLFKNNFKRLDKLEPVDIMVTHYCPINTEDSFQCFDGEYHINKLTPKLWIFGGIMKFDDTVLNKTLLTNAFNLNNKIRTITIYKGK